MRGFERPKDPPQAPRKGQQAAPPPISLPEAPPRQGSEDPLRRLQKAGDTERQEI